MNKSQWKLKCPRLYELLKNGHIEARHDSTEGGNWSAAGDPVTFVGITPTGEVQLGRTGDEAAIESYLTDNPTPSKW